MSYFLQLAGIDGDAIERGHENWFTIAGVAWGVSQSGGGGSGGGAGAGRPTLRPIVLSTLISASTPKLFVQCASGRHIARAVVEAVRESEQPTVAWRWQLEDVLLTSLDLAGSDGDPALTQTFSISYRRLRMTTFTQTPGGAHDIEVTGGWDVATGTSLT